ncbi:alpha-ketoglutarate transporter [Salmonella enterica subsp. enterica serovar Heidelberg str. RI-11-014316]|nr:alpha-ketoglutarate transporter [Salmonella enterica subsp. enterica serovar Heidelberg str. RI-11-014316]
MAEIIQRIDKNNAEAPEMRRRIWAIVGASSGNLVEWFDFYVYSFCSLYFAHIFFPSGNTTTQLLQTAGVFAVRFFNAAYRWLAIWTHCRSTRAQSLNVDFGVHDVHGVAGDCLLTWLRYHRHLGTGAATYCKVISGALGRGRVWDQRDIYE